MVFLMEVMVYGCITGMLKINVQFNGQLVLLDTPSPLLVRLVEGLL
jgi:hypothetical protein